MMIDCSKRRLGAEIMEIGASIKYRRCAERRMDPFCDGDRKPGRDRHDRFRRAEGAQVEYFEGFICKDRVVDQVQQQQLGGSMSA